MIWKGMGRKARPGEGMKGQRGCSECHVAAPRHLLTGMAPKLAFHIRGHTTSRPVPAAAIRQQDAKGSTTSASDAHKE
jgi:hypothetical protein